MKKVLVCDSSLLSVVENGTFVLSFKEKLEIAKRLSELCVDVIEVSSSGTEKADDVLVKTICNCVTGSVVSCVAGNSVERIESNFALIAGAKKKRLNIVMPVSPVQMEYFVSKKPALVLDLLKTLTEKAVSLCDDVEVTLSDATRAESEFLFDAIKVAILAGAKTISVQDLAGNLLPGEFSDFIKGICSAVPELKNVKLLVSASDALGLGIANSMAAIVAGADGIKLSAVKTDALPSVERFSFAMENTKGDGYVSEKIIDSFLAGTIPIYYGDYMVDEYINPKAYILVKDEYDMKKKIEYIIKIDNNDELYSSILNENIFNEDYKNIIKENYAERAKFLSNIFKRGKLNSKRVDKSYYYLNCFSLKD